VVCRSAKRGGGELLIPVRIRQRSLSEKLAVISFWIAVAVLYLGGVVLAINNAAVAQSIFSAGEILPAWWADNRELLENGSIYAMMASVAVLVRT